VVRGQADGCTPWESLLDRTCAEGVEAADPNAVKLVLYTSGTTGNPKGVLHSHNTIMSEIDAVIGFWGITQRDVVLMPSPVTHITGYLYALEVAFAAGVKVVFMERWNAAQAADLIAEHGVTFSVGATPFLKELVAEVETRRSLLPSLRLFMSGGAPVPPELIHRANAVLKGCLAFRVYGSSEAPTVTLGIRSRAEAQRGADTDGRIVNHEVRLCDPVTGAPMDCGSEGEICTRGPEMMLGYTDPAQTEDSFDADGYFHTGDLGYFVEGGYLCINGRKKDLIIRGGENISPKEIEDVLHTHPAIREAAVVAMPHERLGEGVCAFVIAQPGHGIDVAGMAAFLEQAGLARQKFPERVELVEDLPRTASGKVQKNVLRERLRRDAG
jgi:acyl-CoA synthetase (AMP-forming)/AMP-acid ligase II